MHSHSWSLVVTRGQLVVIRGHSWSLVVTRGHSWSLVVTRGHSCVLLDTTGKYWKDEALIRHRNEEITSQSDAGVLFFGCRRLFCCKPCSPFSLCFYRSIMTWQNNALNGSERQKNMTQDSVNISS